MIFDNIPLIDDFLYEDIQLDIAKYICSNDIITLSICSTLLNNIIHDRLIIKRIVHSIHPKMSQFIKNKDWHNINYYVTLNGNYQLITYISTSKFKRIYNRRSLNECFYESVRDGDLNRCEYFVYKGATDLKNAMIYASKYGHLDICKFIVSRDNYRVRSSIDYKKALEYAAKYDHLDIYEYLNRM